MYYSRFPSITLYIAFAIVAAALLLVVTSGCQSDEKIEPIVLGSPALLFDDIESTPIASTDFGRDPWPAVRGPIESIEQIRYYQVYNDYQGSASNERNSPWRYTRSVRVGSQSR